MNAPFVLGIIPARGGSKGIPGKNIVPLGGIPLIAHTLNAAQKSRRLNDTILSTDSPEIEDMARQLGTAVPFFRPAELAGDMTPSVLVVRHAVEAYEAERSVRVDLTVLLQPTSPFRRADDIDGALERFCGQPEAECLISCYRSEGVHPRIMYMLRENRLAPIVKNPEGPSLRRQEFEDVYVRNGAIYITSRRLLMEDGTLVGDSPLCYVMPENRSLNIDSPADLEQAEALMVRYGNRTIAIT